MLPEIWSVTDVIFCHFRPFFVIFCPFTPTTRKIKILKKKKKAPGDFIILPKIMIIWHDMACDRCFFVVVVFVFSFWPIFCPFTTLMAQKIKHF